MHKYNGITMIPSSGKYRAQINRRGKIFYLGVYDDAGTAARMVDRAVNLTRGWEFRPTRLNFEDGINPTKEPAEEMRTENEQAMLTYLRDNYPIDEGSARHEAAVRAEIPDVLARDAVAVEKAMAHLKFLGDDYLRSSQETIARQGRTIAELKGKLAHMEIRLEDMDKERAGALATQFTPTGQRRVPGTAAENPLTQKILEHLKKPGAAGVHCREAEAQKATREKELMEQSITIVTADIRAQLGTCGCPVGSVGPEGEPGIPVEGTVGPEGAGCGITVPLLNEVAARTIAEQNKVSEVTVTPVDQEALDREALKKVANPFGRITS